MNLDAACKRLFFGGCVAYPTETCWGLGVRADSQDAVEGLRKLKGRQVREPFSILIPEPAWLERLGVVASEAHRRLMDAFWPGPVTLLFTPEVGSTFAHLASPLLGVRCSSHPAAQELVSCLGIPITSTSANRHGEPVAPCAQDIRKVFSSGEVLVLDLPDRDCSDVSTVVAIEADGSLRILREGVVSRRELERALE